MTAVFIIAAVAVSLSNIICLIAGAYIGQKLRSGEALRIPLPAAKEPKDGEGAELEKEREALEIMLSNIDAYDGTDIGQREIKP